MLKSFDFFRKIQTDQQLTSTTGGCFTILAFLSAFILIFLSIQDYYHETYYTFLAVKNDDSQYLPMRIDITFNKMPCHAIEISFHDQLEYVENNLQDKLNMWTINNKSQEAKYVRKQSRDDERKDLQQALKNNYQCRLNGIINVPKTPGTIIFRSLGNLGIIQAVDQALANQARLSYKLKVLQFGLGNNTFDFPIAHKSPIVQKYIKQLQGNIANRQLVQDLSRISERVNFYNHLKIIPVTFDQNSSLIQSGQKYRYSLRAGQAQTFSPKQQLNFYTEIQPINIVYRRQQASVYNFAVSLLAIVGGTVATIGIVNSVSHFLFKIQ